MTPEENRPERYVEAIRQSGLSIYDPIAIGDPELWIPTPELEVILNRALQGISVAGLSPRTRSKIFKEHVCRVLGYPVPKSFKKTRPRFPGQCFDAYGQKRNNLQIWNEEVVPTRRYVFFRVSADGLITRIKVVTGDTLARLDTTGTLTQKYQARLIRGDTPTELITPQDTDLLQPFAESIDLQIAASPISHPVAGQLLPIDVIFKRLFDLVGQSFPDSGYDQDRNRGAAMHRLVCAYLGYSDYRDSGKLPDVLHQLLEVKLQTSSTIDLGLVCPNSTEVIPDVPQMHGYQIRYCDIRYALFCAKTDGRNVTLTHFYLVTGEQFFSRFSQFQGKVVNKKLQIPLPRDFFAD